MDFSMSRAPSVPPSPNRYPPLAQEDRVSLPVGNTSFPDAPKRPLSAYNIFFQMERKRMVSDEEDPSESSSHRRPFTRAEVLGKDSYTECVPRSKRPHRKVHGKITFQDLTKIIVTKWKNLDDSERELFVQRAEEEKRLYTRNLQGWLSQQPPTPQVKKRISALRRGSLAKYLDTDISMDNKTDPYRKSPISVNLPTAMMGPQEIAPVTTAISSVPQRHPAFFFPPRSTDYSSALSYRQERVPSLSERTRHLQSLYQKQVEMYEEQLRLQEEYEQGQAVLLNHRDEEDCGDMTTKTPSSRYHADDDDATPFPLMPPSRTEFGAEHPRAVSETMIPPSAAARDEDWASLSFPNDAHTLEHFPEDPFSEKIL